MKKTGLVMIVGALLAANGILYVFAGDESHSAVSPSVPVVKNQTLCPVMGGQVNTNLYADADGKRIYVCCAGCVGEVKKDPAKYIKKLESEGITLQKIPLNSSPKEEEKKTENDSNAHSH